MAAENIIRIPRLFSEKGKVYHFTNDALIITSEVFKNIRTEIPKEKIASLRFGIEWVKGFYFPIGRNFKIELKLDDGSVLSLSFASYYGIKKKLYTAKYQHLINTVWENLFQADLNDIAVRFRDGETLYINGVEFNKDGLRWGEKELLFWDKIQLKEYITYFVIRHIDNAKLNKSFYFLTDWDSFLLQQVLKHIIQQRAKYADQKYEINLN
ncbi:MAG: hypothetical protein V4592_16335 [Bacteroidota bacterium]